MKIELTDNQAYILIAALDLYSRVNMGQLWALAEAIQNARTKRGEPVMRPFDIRENFTDPMTFQIFDYLPNASHGICSPLVPESAKAAYDMQCVIRRDIAQRESDSHSVWLNEPLHTAKVIPLIKILDEKPLTPEN